MEQFGSPEAKDEKEVAKVIQLYNQALEGGLAEDEGVITLLLHGREGEDILHSNSIQVLEKAIPGLWREGDMLICIRDLDMIAVIDHESGLVIWHWGAQELQRPHHPTYLADGTILIFDNGTFRGHSRIIKLDPVGRKIVWQYKAASPADFFSYYRGGCQELPNGNILITESNKGRVFEITPEGKIVWEFFSEISSKGETSVRRAIYRMMRLDPRIVEPLLKENILSGTSGMHDLSQTK